MDLRPLHPLAARQRDLLTARDLLRAGIDKASVDAAVRRGRLHAVFPGVYGLGVHRDRADLWLAAVLASGPAARITHGAAVAHWGCGRERTVLVEVSARRSRVGSEGVLLHRPRRLPPPAVRFGIPVSSMLDTLIDLADVVSFDELLTVAMEADHRRLVDLRALRPISGRRGTARVQRLIEYCAEGSRSELEWLARGCFATLPRFDANVWVHRRRLDCVWRDERIGLECDSYEHHRQRRKFESDRRVPLELELHGWHVIRVTWRQMRYDPELVLSAVSSALRRRGWAA